MEIESHPFGCSIIIASYNRSGLLDETLRSLANHLRQSPGGKGVEVIVVDNNSSDDTAAVAERHSSSFERYRVVKELKQGLSHARNAGVAAAGGDVIVFLDDDVELGEGWLAKLLEPFEALSVGAAGGRVLPFGEKALPDWLPREYGYLVSVFDPSDVRCEVDKVMGANFAVRASFFTQVGGFDPALGRQGRKLMGGEEVELFLRVTRAGLKIVYEPGAIVYHKIGEKLNRDYVVDYAYWLGASEALLDRKLHGAFKYCLKLFRSALFPVSVYPVMSWFASGETEKLRQAIKTRYAKGYWAQAMGWH